MGEPRRVAAGAAVMRSAAAHRSGDTGKTRVCGRGLARRLGRALGGLALLMIVAPGAFAQFVLDAVPGGLVQIPLLSADQPRPEAYFGQKRIMVIRFAGRWEGVVGLPLTMVPGTYVIQLRLDEPEDDDGENVEDRAFTVYPGRGTGRPAATFPGPPPAAHRTDFAWREPLDAALPLRPPVEAAARPTFGRIRPQSDGSHPPYADYTAFTIDRDMPVMTPGAGRVAATLTQESGIYAWIDHGMTLYTRLGPLADLAVNESDHLEAEQVIGRIRLDEDDTPQPFYLSVFLNSAAVNPFLIFDMQKKSDSAGDQTGPAASRQP